MSLINEQIFLKAPLHRPSHMTKLQSLTSEEALDRFVQEQTILESQLYETWVVKLTKWLSLSRILRFDFVLSNICSETFYKYLLDVRAKRKSGQDTFEQLSELTEGFYVKTEIELWAGRYPNESAY